MKIPFKCVVCLGCGNVPGGFYLTTVGHVESWAATSTTDICKACNGTGIILSDDATNYGSQPKHT